MKAARTIPERGIAILEAAAWATVMLPVAMLAAHTCLLVHDQRVMAIIPEAVLREEPLPALSWTGDGEGGTFGVSGEALRRAASSLAARASAEANASLLRTSRISARACCWVYAVDEITGRAGVLRQEACATAGPQALEARLAAELNSLRARPIGVRSFSVSGTQDYVPTVIIAGVALGGDFSPAVPALKQQQLQFAHVSFPRQEVTL